LRSEIEALDPTGLEAATDAAAAMVAERCGDGAFETSLQALVVETRVSALGRQLPLAMLVNECLLVRVTHSTDGVSRRLRR
jgi:hypothetical protein